MAACSAIETKWDLRLSHVVLHKNHREVLILIGQPSVVLMLILYKSIAAFCDGPKAKMFVRC